MPKCENLKRRITQNVEYRDFGYWEMERQGSFAIRSPEVPKRETQNSRSRHIIPRFQLPGNGEVIDSHHLESRSAEI
jgi:hypothetical protein